MHIDTVPTREMRSFSLPKILIVEDDDAIADVLKQLFQMSGYSCMTLRSVLDICQIMREYRPDLVIVDYLLPEVNGGELCAQIKRNEETATVPVIICSAYSKVLMSLGTYGSDAFISKPFDLHQLTQTIERLLGLCKLQKRLKSS